MTRAALLLLVLGLVCPTVGLTLWLGQPALVSCLLVIGFASLAGAGVLLFRDVEPIAGDDE